MGLPLAPILIPTASLIRFPEHSYFLPSFLLFLIFPLSVYWFIPPKKKNSWWKSTGIAIQQGPKQGLCPHGTLESRGRKANKHDTISCSLW